MYEMASLSEKWRLCVRSGLSLWEMNQICVKWLRYVINSFDLSELASISIKWLRNVRKGLSMWEMTQICGKWFKYVGNGLYMW